MLTAMEAAPFRAQKAFGTNDAGTVYADGAFVHVDGCRRRNRSRAHPTWPILLTFAIFAAWLVVAIATYQESPGDMPTIMALFRN